MRPYVLMAFSTAPTLSSFVMVVFCATARRTASASADRHRQQMVNQPARHVQILLKMTGWHSITKTALKAEHVEHTLQLRFRDAALKTRAPWCCCWSGCGGRGCCPASRPRAPCSCRCPCSCRGSCRGSSRLCSCQCRGSCRCPGAGRLQRQPRCSQSGLPPKHAASRTAADALDPVCC
jgi:hypothetical protein